MSVGVRLLIAALVAVLLGSVPAPATAVPASLDVALHPNGGGATIDNPFLGEMVTVQSVSMETTGGRDLWTCSIDYGDGTSGGFWRAQSYDYSAPCAGHHTYAAAGTYELSMTVTDNEGKSVTEQRELEVVARPVVARTAGVEGTAITLAAKNGTTPSWSFDRTKDNDRCKIGRRQTATMKVTCYADGAIRVNYDTGSAATSGAYDVTWTNGAPRPTMQATRATGTKRVPVRRIGTGDQVWFDVRANDPSTRGTKGDQLRCVFNHGNGQRETQKAYQPKGTCNGLTSYLAPGRHTSRVRITDADGASGVARASVIVVRRDVHLAVRDVRAGGPGGSIAASLTPRGLRGRVSLRFPDGRSLISTRLTSIQVSQGSSVSLLGHAKVDGKGGYRFVVFPDTTYPQGMAFYTLAWKVGDAGNYVLNETVYRKDFRVHLRARSIH